MHSAVTSAEITASAVMKTSVLRRCRGKVTCEIHLGLEITAVQRCQQVHSDLVSWSLTLARLFVHTDGRVEHEIDPALGHRLAATGCVDAGPPGGLYE